MYKLKTVDIWDTILRRKSHPDFAKLAIAQYIILQHPDMLHDKYLDKWAIYRERCQIEAEIVHSKRKAALDSEYTLFAVLQDLLKRVFKKPLDSSSFIIDLIEQEIQFEIANTYIDSEIKSILQMHTAEKTIFLSDFYMSSDHIKKILLFHKATELVPDGGFSSCDISLNKFSGNLFKHIHKAYAISPNEHLHIGDNRHSDFKIPKAMGCEVIHYLPETEHAQRLKRENLFVSRSTLFEHIAAEVVSELNEDSKNCDNANAYILGSKVAPLFIGYILFIAEQAVKNKLDTLLFMTREGEFYKQIFDVIFANGNLHGVPLPETQLLEVSRLSTFCASLSEVSINEMMRLWSLYNSQSIAALCLSLGVDVALVKPLCEKYEVKFDEAINRPWQDQRIIALFKDNAFVELIDKTRNKAHKNLKQYLAQKIKSTVARVGLVDIGWRGTIQDNIARILPNTAFLGFYLGLARFFNPQLNNCQKLCYGPNLNLQAKYENLLDNVSLLEMVSNSPNGSVTGYREDEAGGVHAVKIISADENKTFYEYVTHFQQGVLAAAKVWARYIPNHVITSDELHATALDIWHQLAHHTPADIIHAHVNLVHNEIFGAGQFINKAYFPSLKALLLVPFSRVHRINVITFIKQMQNPHYILKRKDIKLFKKLLWSSIMVSALVYKRTLLKLRRS